MNDVLQPEAPSGSTPGTVLLVDDDPVMRTLMVMALAGLGCEVLTTADGEQALELVESRPERKIHLLITDILMPRMGGNELASRLQSFYPNLQVLYCSGHARHRVLQEAPGSETAAFLQKPFSREALVEMVKSMLEPALQ